MLCIWWDIEGIFHCELLGRNVIVTSECYCQKIFRLEEAIQQKRQAVSTTWSDFSV
jgi:hypothetical protein